MNEKFIVTLEGINLVEQLQDRFNEPIGNPANFIAALIKDTLAGDLGVDCSITAEKIEE